MSIGLSAVGGVHSDDVRQDLSLSSTHPSVISSPAPLGKVDDLHRPVDMFIAGTQSTAREYNSGELRTEGNRFPAHVELAAAISELLLPVICYIARYVPRSLRRNRRNACPPLRYSNSASVSVFAGVLVTSSSANRNTILCDECIHAVVCKQNYRPRSHNNRSLVLEASSLPPEAYLYPVSYPRIR